MHEQTKAEQKDPTPHVVFWLWLAGVVGLGVGYGVGAMGAALVVTALFVARFADRGGSHAD